MAIKKSSHSAPGKGKNGNSLTAVLEQATFPAESLTEKKADIGVAKTPKNESDSGCASIESSIISKKVISTIPGLGQVTDE